MNTKHLQIIEYAKTGKNASEISRLVGCDRGTVLYQCNKNNIEVAKGSNRKTYFNEHFFDHIDTEEKAYSLGFFLADGYSQNEKTVEWQIQERDRDILEQISSAIEYSGELKSVKRGVKQQVRLELHSIIIYSAIEKFNLNGAKSFKAKIPNEIICGDLLRHFVRGVWDGDGYIGKRQATLVTASEDLKNQIIQIAESRFGFLLWNKKIQNTFRINVSKKHAGFIDWIYSDCKIALKRKLNAKNEFIPNKTE